MNYTNWQIEKWSTPVSEFNDLFMASLTDNNELQIILNGGEKDSNARLQFTFDTYPAYRNILEEYRVALWAHLDGTKQRCGWTFVVRDSQWVESLCQSESLLAMNYPNLRHWVIATWDDVIEVLSPNPPEIKSV